VDSQHALVELGATTFVEVGPGNALAGMAKRTVPDVPVVNVATPDDLAGALEQLAEPALEVAP
jgi:[acyl-carrier-protein] S-malonyltransferase